MKTKSESRKYKAWVVIKSDTREELAAARYAIQEEVNIQ